MSRVRPLLASLALALLASHEVCAQAPLPTTSAAASTEYSEQPAQSRLQVGPATTADGKSQSFLRTTAGSQYVVQPGDVYELNLIYYGQTGEAAATILVDVVLEEDGTVTLPLVGVVGARGMTFGELRKTALAKMRQSAAVVHVDLLLKTPAVFTVFVSGAVRSPGYVMMNGLTTVRNAISQAGGTREGASLRRITLLRDGEERSVDLLRYATGRYPDSNPFLRAKDRIYVPLARGGVRIQGPVESQGQYEIEPGESLADLLELAGNPASALPDQAVYVTRPDASGGYSMKRIEGASISTFALAADDTVTIPSAPQPAMVTVEGSVMRQPGQASVSGARQDPSVLPVPSASLVFQVAYSPGLTLLGLLDMLDGPSPLADTQRSFVARASDGTRIPVDVTSLWRTRNPAADVPIEPGDRIVIPPLKLNIAVTGQVQSPRTVPFVTGQTAGDYIRDAGGVTPGIGAKCRIWATTRGGDRRRVDWAYEPLPGETIEVGAAPPAAFAQFFSRYVFPITGVVYTLAVLFEVIVEAISYVK